MKKVWIFFEMVEKDKSSIFRGIATSKQVKENFERSLTDEMRIRKTKNWWTVEENLLDHLYANSMYNPYMLVSRGWKKYKVGNRELDGD